MNGPNIAVLTARTPNQLRAKVMTAVISVNTLAAPLGFLVAGQVLEHGGVVPLFTVVVLGITWMAIVFAAITWRYEEEARTAGELAVTQTWNDRRRGTECAPAVLPLARSGL